MINQDQLSEFGEFTTVRTNKFSEALQNTILTPYRSGYIDLKEHKIQQKMQRDNFSKTIKDILPDSDCKHFAFVDFIMNPAYFEVLPGRISFASITTRIKEFYRIFEAKFEKNIGDFGSKNHHLIEYQFFFDGYTVIKESKASEYHLLLFSAVESKETIESKLLRYPNLSVNPGQVLTMMIQVAETLRELIFETDIFGDEKGPTLPLLPRLPGLLLGDIWIFGKWYYKLNWVFGLLDPEDSPFLSKGIKNSINEAIKGNTEISQKDFYNYNLYSLAQIAIKYLKPTYKENEMHDLKEFKKHVELSFMNEFKEEAELLYKIIEHLLKGPDEDFNINNFIKNNKDYQNRDPIKNLLLEVFEEKGISLKKRLENIQKTIIDQSVPRGLELKILHELVKNTDMKRRIGTFTTILNDTETNQAQPQSQPPKGPTPAFLEIHYPLDSKDICNINANATNTTNERISCQIHPLFDKDFFVYKSFTSHLMLSIEFSDDLTYLLSALSQTIGYLNGELDPERRVVFRSALNTQAFENELESHINALDTLALITTLVMRKLNFCIEYEEFGRIGKNVRLILDEIDFHVQRYRDRKHYLAREDHF